MFALILMALLSISGCGARSEPAQEGAFREFDAGAIDTGAIDTGAIDTGPRLTTEECDEDGDGFRAARCGGDDCNDDEAAIHPGADDLNATPGAFTTVLGPSLGRGDFRPPLSLALTPEGSAFVAWASDGTEGGGYASNMAGDFEVVPLPDVSSSMMDLAVDYRGWVHLSYAGEEGLHYVKTPAGEAAFQRVLVDRQGGGWSALALDRDRVLIAYESEGGLSVAVGRADGFEHRVVEADGGGVLSGSWGSGAFHLAFSRMRAGLPQAVRYGRWSDEGFRSEQVAPVSARSLALTLGVGALPHIAWASRRVGYALRREGAWQRVDVEELGVPWSVGLGVGETGAVQLVVQADGVMHGARDAAGELRFQGLGWGYGVDMVLDRAGVVHIVFTRFLFGSGTRLSYVSNRVLELDGVDANCDGVDGVDLDGDGVASRWTGGTDEDDFPIPN